MFKNGRTELTSGQMKCPARDGTEIVGNNSCLGADVRGDGVVPLFTVVPGVVRPCSHLRASRIEKGIIVERVHELRKQAKRLRDIAAKSKNRPEL